jgi:dTDP-4-dehydrorhamnose reductase
MSDHLVIGASGQVGEDLVHVLSLVGYETIGTYYSHPVQGMQKLDITNAQEVQSMLTKIRPSVVYLPASLTNVDYCEKHPEQGYAVNVIGVCNVVQTVSDIGAKLVYFSSDYIFDGEAGPYRENAPANPICEYGRQKVIAEHYVALHARDYLIVRTTVVYGWERQRKNFICRLLSTLEGADILRVPVDQVGNPTYAPNLAQATLDLVCSDAKGVYHIVGPERVNRYEFACEAARVFGLDASLIKAVSTCELGQVAPRPLNAGMVVEKAADELKVSLVGYEEGLRMMASERCYSIDGR